MYATASVHALDGLFETDRIDNAWHERHTYQGWFAAHIGDGLACIATALERALRSRSFLAGNGARVQEIDPAKGLPVDKVKELLAEIADQSE